MPLSVPREPALTSPSKSSEIRLLGLSASLMRACRARQWESQRQRKPVKHEKSGNDDNAMVVVMQFTLQKCVCPFMVGGSVVEGSLLTGGQTVLADSLHYFVPVNVKSRVGGGRSQLCFFWTRVCSGLGAIWTFGLEALYDRGG